MSRKRVPPVSEPPLREQDTSYEEAEDVSELDEQLAGLPSDNTVLYLWRMYDRGRPKYLHRMEPGEFDVEGIKNIYGGGRYRYVVKERGKGTVREGMFEIDGMPQAPVVSHPSADGGNTAGLVERLVKIEDSIKRQDQSLSERLLTMLITRPTDETTEEKLLHRLSLYKSLFSSEVGSGKAIIETVKELIPLISAQEGGSVWPLLIDKLSPMLEKMTTMQQPQLNASQISRQTTPSPLQETMPMTPSADLQAIAKQLIPVMISAASRDLDPATYATIIHDYVTSYPSLQTTIKHMLSRPDWFEWLARIEPKVRLQEAWWRDCREQCLTLMIEETNNENSSPEKEKETNNAQTNEPSQTPRSST